MEERLTAIEHKLDLILSELQKRKVVDERLDRHISFIERTYDRLRSPLDYIRSAYDRMVRIAPTDPLEQLEAEQR